MSDLSEEEIIKNIKEMIQWSDHSTYKMALQGLLDLYNKEKAKNKELLENATVTYFNDEELKESVGNYLGVLLKKNIEKDYISKDKIREQIKQIKSEEANIYFKEHVVYFLQELLEEE